MLQLRSVRLSLACAAACFLIPPLHAEAVAFKPGDLIVVARDYDHKTDSFSEGAPKGEEHACFRVDTVSSDEIDITLVAGPYHPWWSDTPFEPGHTDTLVRAEGYADHHPSAPPLELHGLVYRVVPSCPGAS